VKKFKKKNRVQPLLPARFITRLARHVDPELQRTLLCLTGLDEHSNALVDTEATSSFFNSIINSKNAFLVTLQNDPKQETELAEYLWDVRSKDIATLDKLQYDKRCHTKPLPFRSMEFFNFFFFVVYSWAARLGATLFKRYVLDISWKAYQDTFPSVLSSFRQKQDLQNRELQLLQSEAGAMNSSILRTTAGSYCVAFLQNVSSLITGSLTGLPSKNGQTLAEEASAQGITFFMNNILMVPQMAAGMIQTLLP